MMRTSFVALLLLVTAESVAAQNRGRPGGIGGGFRPASSTQTPLPPIAGLPAFPAMSPPPAGLSGGFAQPGRPNRPPVRPGFPPHGVWPGFGGWLPFYGYPLEYPVPVEVPVPVYVPTGPPDPQVELSGEMTATLVLQFPAPAEIWVNGTKSTGEAQTEWTLTSPAIHVGTEYPFAVKARWKSSGKTFEYEKTVAVAAGTRSRSLVISGTEIKN